MASLKETVLVDGVVYPAGTEKTKALASKIPAKFWDEPVKAEPEKKSE